MTANDHDTANPVPHDLPLGAFGVTSPLDTWADSMLDLLADATTR